MTPSPWWINIAFARLWAAATISQFGTMLTALPLTALLFLDASPAQMGLLTAAGSAPSLLFSLIAGVWIDRLPRRTVMASADFGRFACLLLVPLAAVLDVLSMAQLYTVAFVAGSLDVLFNLAYRAVLPALLAHDRLVEANSRLHVGESVATSAAPPIGGTITQLLSAPVAVLIDALSFLASGLLVLGLPKKSAARPFGRGSMWSEITSGVRVALSNRLLRPLLGMVGSYSFFAGFHFALYAYWVVESLGFSPTTYGVILGASGVSALLGALAASPVSRRVGLGPSIVVTYVAAASLTFLTPLAGFAGDYAIILLLADFVLSDALWIVHNVGVMTVRQMATSSEQLGRANACFLLAGRGMFPLGAALGGLLAAEVGVQTMLFVAAAGIFVSGAWLIWSPIWRIQKATDVMIM